MAERLNIRSLSKTYGRDNNRVDALHDVDLAVNHGEFVAVQGPSGCGKSTLLLIAGGLLAPDSGTVRVDGQDIYALNVEQRAAFRATNIGFVFQQFLLVPYLSVFENVLAATLPLRRNGAADRARALIVAFGLTDRMRHVPAKLSVGERQRVALARALMNDPKLILADEPTGNLDAANAERVLAALRQFAADGGSVLLVTHDREAAARADRVVALDKGQRTTSLTASEGVQACATG